MKTVGIRKRRAAEMLQEIRWSGFTLAELIVVITILSILATVGFLALSGYSQDAKDSAVKANVRSLYSAISSESAITWNSPRYYVVHDTGAALSWGVAFVDGTPTALTWGNWNAAGTNYSAGNPDFTKLKINPDKFKISGIPRLGEVAEAAYDSKIVSVGAFDASMSANGRKRSAGFFQVVGTSPSTGTVSVAGNFPTNIPGSVAWLVRNPSSSSSTGALVDGETSWSTSATAQSVTVGWDDVNGRKWSDGTYAVSCSGYLNPVVPKAYAWSTGSGTYLIDPDWSGGNPAFKAYCDMAGDGGGWTLIWNSVSDYSQGFTNSTVTNTFDKTANLIVKSNNVPFQQWRFKNGGAYSVRTSNIAWGTIQSYLNLGFTSMGFETDTWKKIATEDDLFRWCWDNDAVGTEYSEWVILKGTGNTGNDCDYASASPSYSPSAYVSEIWIR